MTRYSTPISLLSALALLSGCSTPETRIRNGLVEAGLPRPVAACMAERMVDKLSLVQLRRLQSLSSLKDKNVQSMSIDELMHKIRALRDPEIVAVTSKAALVCSISH